MVKRLELSPYKNPSTTVFTGRPQGYDVREILKLETLDKSAEKVDIIIPADTTSFNPSFFLGLLYDSIRKLGMDRFNQKYKLVITTDDQELHDVIESNLQDGFRNALNSLNKRTGLNANF